MQSVGQAAVANACCNIDAIALPTPANGCCSAVAVVSILLATIVQAYHIQSLHINADLYSKLLAQSDCIFDPTLDAP